MKSLNALNHHRLCVVADLTSVAVLGSNPALAVTYRDLGQVLHFQLPAALWRESPSSIVGLKRRYRNSLNEYKRTDCYCNVVIESLRHRAFVLFLAVLCSAIVIVGCFVNVVVVVVVAVNYLWKSFWISWMSWNEFHKSLESEVNGWFGESCIDATTNKPRKLQSSKTAT